MQNKTLHIKNLEKYTPGYKDRHLIWFKLYFSMLNGDQEFEMIDEIDKWRFVAFTVIELQTKKPVNLDSKYLIRKGFDFKKKSLSDTIQALSPFVVICNRTVTGPLQDCNSSVTHIRLEENRLEENKIDKDKYLDFVFLSKNEFDKLQQKFGEQGTTDRIKNLNDYGHQKQKKFKEYTSHYHTILAWEKNNDNRQQPKQKPASKYSGLDDKNYHEGAWPS